MHNHRRILTSQPNKPKSKHTHTLSFPFLTSRASTSKPLQPSSSARTQATPSCYQAMKTSPSPQPPTPRHNASDSPKIKKHFDSSPNASPFPSLQCKDWKRPCPTLNHHGPCPPLCCCCGVMPIPKKELHKSEIFYLNEESRKRRGVSVCSPPKKAAVSHLRP